MDLVKAEQGTTCDLCNAPARVCDLDGICEQAFFCAEHAPLEEGA